MTTVENSPFRIGAVSFLNTVPLLGDMADDSTVSLILDLPSRLADHLFEERIDVGLIPSVEYLRGVGGDIVPGIGIGCLGPVHSVKVFSRVPLDRAQNIAVDRGSRSSIALLRIVLAERYGRFPDLFVTEPDADAPLANADTLLVIGDRALEIGGGTEYEYDLGQMWHELTGLPFVFAVWVLSRAMSQPRAAATQAHLIARLQQAKATGLASLEALSKAESTKRNVAASAVLKYWQQNIRYDLGEEELAGLSRFAELGAKHNLCSGRTAVSLAQA